MPQFDLITFFTQSFWLSVFLALFYFIVLQYLLKDLFYTFNIRKKIYQLTVDLNVKIKKNLLSDTIWSKIID